jgi:hypothetical protein
MGSIERYEKTTFTSFVSRLHFCADAVVFRHVWHLADSWFAFPLAHFGSIEHGPHVTWVEDKRRLLQHFHDDFCAPYGS